MTNKNNFQTNVRKNYNVVYVQCNDTIHHAFRYVMNESNQHPFFIESFDDILYERSQCRESLIFEAIDNDFDLHDLNDFLDNHHATKLCRCDDSECNTTFYFVSQISFEQQNFDTLKYVNRVLVENSSNEFVELMIDEHYDLVA